MVKRVLWFLIRCTALAVLGCLVLAALRELPAFASEKETSKEQQAAIRKVLDDQVVSWNKGNLEGFMAGYWNSAELSFSSGKDKTRGWQATFDRYKKRYQSEGREMGKLSFSELEIDMLCPESAFVRGRWKLVQSKETPEGLFTLIFKKFPEGWRIVHDHTSN
jgi:hypothetical protein